MRKLSKCKWCLFVDGENQYSQEAVLTASEIKSVTNRSGKIFDDAIIRREAEIADLKTKLAELEG